MMLLRSLCFVVKEPATTEIYPLSLPDALPILAEDRDGRSGRLRVQLAKAASSRFSAGVTSCWGRRRNRRLDLRPDRKSTRLNSSHANTSYAVFRLKTRIGQKEPGDGGRHGRRD